MTDKILDVVGLLLSSVLALVGALGVISGVYTLALQEYGDAVIEIVGWTALYGAGMIFSIWLATQALEKIREE